MKRLFFLFLSFNLHFSSLVAEIEKVTVSWRSILCRGACGPLLSKQFSRIKGVSNININQEAGIAELSWKPNEKFFFQPIATAMGLVGLSIQEVRVKVRGTITSNGRQISIVSLGDNTTFILLGTVLPYKNTVVVQANPANRQLTPEMQQNLYAAQRAHKVATIEGPLFMPERSPPLLLIAGLVEFSEEEQNR